jgi:hypothetical protein
MVSFDIDLHAQDQNYLYFDIESANGPAVPVVRFKHTEVHYSQPGPFNCTPTNRGVADRIAGIVQHGAECSIAEISLSRTVASPHASGAATPPTLLDHLSEPSLLAPRTHALTSICE